MSRAVWFSLATAVAVLAVLSQTAAADDTGFHLLAARLIGAGRLPYRDFFYQHPPLYPLLSAAWMHVFGETWRSAHALSVVLLAGGLYLAARFVVARIQDARWRAVGAAMTIWFIALQEQTALTATADVQAPLLWLLLLAALTLLTGDQPISARRIFWAGAAAGGAAATSLFALPPLAVLLVWSVARAPRLARGRQTLWLAAGLALGLAPLVALAFPSWSAAWRDIIAYQLFYRGGHRGAFAFDYDRRMDLLRVYSTWLTSAQPLMLGALALVGLAYAGRAFRPGGLERSALPVPTLEPSGIGPGDRTAAELRLCGWMALASALVVAIPNPTYFGYFAHMLPFVAILAGVGLGAVGSRLVPNVPPVWLALGIGAVFALGLARPAHLSPGQAYWRELDDVMRFADRVTPAGGELYASEEDMYFLSRRLPPEGLENSYAVELPASEAAASHAATWTEIDGWLAGGRFATVVVRTEDPRVAALSLLARYKQSARFGASRHYLVLWDGIGPSTGKESSR